VATAQAHVMEVSRGSARSGICAALCIRRTLCRHVTIGTPCTIRQKHSKPLVYQSSQVYQDCTNSVPTVYQSSKTVKISQKQSKNSENSKNDHWCTNRYISTKTVPTVYRQCTNRQKQSKTVKRQSKQQK